MFNYKKAKAAQNELVQEKNLRENNLGPKADDSAPIYEKKMPHQTGDTESIIEKQFDRSANNEANIIEKVLNDTKSYVQHRSDNGQLSVPPINALVEKMRQSRFEKDYEVTKESNWTVEMDDEAQNAKLPSFPKNAPQHDKIVLNNDPRRFESLKAMPEHASQAENDAAKNKSKEITPLVGKISVASIDRVAEQIKTGGSIDYDTAIVAILSEAEREQRELTSIEQKAIVDLKIARTKAMLK